MTHFMNFDSPQGNFPDRDIKKIVQGRTCHTRSLAWPVHPHSMRRHFERICTDKRVLKRWARSSWKERNDGLVQGCCHRFWNRDRVKKPQWSRINALWLRLRTFCSWAIVLSVKFTLMLRKRIHSAGPFSVAELFVRLRRFWRMTDRLPKTCVQTLARAWRS